jgi:sodium/bile acid cotransporter 7
VSSMLRYWFLFLLPPVMLLGGLFPDGGSALRAHPWVLATLVATILFISGFTLDLRRSLGRALNLRAILLGVVSTYLVAPFLAYWLTSWWTPLGGDGALFFEAVMLAAAQSSTLASAITLTKMARGDEALVLVLTLVSSSLTPFLSPLILKYSLGVEVSFPLGEMMGRMVLVLLLPLFLGQAIRFSLRKSIRRSPPFLRVVQQAIILVFVYVAFSAASSYFKEEVLLAVRFLGVCLVLHLTLLLWTLLSAALLRLSPEARVAVLYSGSQKSVPNGIYLWETFFSANPFGAVPLVLYQLTQLVTGFLIVPWLEKSLGAKRSDFR